MKGYLAILSIVFFSFVVSIGSSFAQTTAVGTVTAWSLNVRSTPTVNAPIIATLRQGYTAGVIGKNSESTWYQIILEGTPGWVNGQYLSVTNAHTIPVTYTITQPTNPPVVNVTGYVNTGALNIRSIPSPTNNVPLTYIVRNTPFTMIGRTADNSWYKIITNNNVSGWVRSTYVAVSTGNVNNLPILSEGAPLPTPVPPSSYAQGFINTGALNIRSLPHPTNNIPLTYFRKNTTVSVIGRTGDSEWYQVSVNGIVGWARGKYITVTSGNVASAPITG